MYYKVNSDNDAINLSKIIKDGDWMVLYYAEWCGHCKTMKPEWNKVVRNIKKDNKSNDNKNNINIAEIESKHIGNLEDKPQIDGYPTIKMYNNGKEIANFNDSRVASKIEEFANSNSTRQKSINLIPSNTVDIPTNTNEYMKTQIDKQPSQKLFSIPSDLQNSIKNNSGLKLNNIIKISYNKSKENNKNSKYKNNIPITNTNIIQRPNFNPINILDIPCSDIRRAKPCKSNPKCRYDGSDFKCKDKIINFEQPLQLNISNTNYKQTNMLNNIISSKKASSGSKKASSGSKKASSGSKKASSGSKKATKTKKSNNYNVRQTTKNVFSKLINSFEKIGNEAAKDSKLLKKASNKL
jgi:thiol-disulfide isomerase/thioredoxin